MMKLTKISIAALLGCFLNLAANAQSIVIKPFIGLNVLNFTKGEGSTELLGNIAYQRDFKGSVGFNGGGYVEIGSRLYCQPGVYWSSINAKVKTYNSGQSSNYTEDNPSVHAFSVPVFIGYRLLGSLEKETLINLRVFGGATYHNIYAVNNTGSSSTSLRKEDFNESIFGANFGAGLDILIFFLDLNYEIGLNSISNNDNGLRANIFSANAGLRIKL